MKKVLCIVLVLVMIFAMTACGSNEYTELEGSYQDNVSQRAACDITAARNGKSANIVVIWTDTDTESVQWTMDAVLETEGDTRKLVYKNCVTAIVTETEDGKNETETLSENGEGYFDLEEGKLLWTGAEDKQCRKCVFEKLMNE